MKVLVSCNLDEFKKCCLNDKVYSVGEDSVFYNIEVKNEEELSEARGLRDERLMCITSMDLDLQGDFFKEISIDEVDSYASVPEKTLCRLPDGFSDMRAIDKIRERFPNIRFIGGNLLELPGLKIGRYDDGKEKLGSVFNGIYDTFLEIRASDLENVDTIKSNISPRMLEDILEVKVKTSKKKAVNRSIAEKKEKPKKVKAAVQSFGSLFGSDDVDF